MNKIALLLALVVALSCVGCSANDGLLDDFYTLNIYPSENNTYDLGSTTYTWAEGYFGMIYLNGVAITSVGTGNVTAALNLTTAMIIRGDGGLKGVQTSLVSIDNFDNINTPGDLDAFDINAGNDLNCVNDLDVTDNADIGGDLDVTGASTFRDIVYFAGPYSRYYDDIEASYGNSSDYWDVYNSGATQFEFWTNDADGIGTDGIIYSVDDDTNTLSVTDDADIGGDLGVIGDASVGGTLDMTDGDINNILQINLTDPTELTINAGVITVTQGFHTVDTEGDAAEDDLDTINGGVTGDELVFKPIHADRTIILRDGIGNINLSSDVSTKSFSFNSPAGAAGRFYAGGFYRAPPTDVALTQASTTQNYGTADIAYGAHAFLVASGPGAVDAGSCSIVVSGTSMTDGGVRSAGDSETVVADITTMALNSYYETIKKWIGTITYTLTPAGATTYSATFNYGLAKYDDIGNQHFHLTDFECVGRAGANDNGFNIRLFHHSDAGWAYSAAAFIPGGTVLANMNTDYNTEIDLSNGEPFAYKRDDLTAEIAGELAEGIVVEITTGANKSVDRMGIHIQYHTVPKLLHLDDVDEAVRLIYNGTGWSQE